MKKIIIGVSVVLVVGLSFFFGLTSKDPVQPSLQGDVRNTSDEFPNGIVRGNGVTENWVGGKIGPRSNQAYFKNTLGETIYVTYAMLATDGTASSTFAVYAATSSATTISDNFNAPWAALIDGTVISTSTPATTTSSLGNQTKQRVVRLRDGESVIFQLQTQCRTVGNCETSTSTNRGFNMFWRLHYHD